MPPKIFYQSSLPRAGSTLPQNIPAQNSAFYVTLTSEDDAIFGIAGLHAIRPKVEPLAYDYLEVLGCDAVRHIQQNYGWYLQMFGYTVTPV